MTNSVKLPNHAILLGSGVLSWPRSERISDRYGAVNLSPDITCDSHHRLRRDNLAGRKGELAALITETRESTHIGDLFRGLYPSTPRVGDWLTLGTGRLFFDEYETVGLYPDDRRSTDWLDPHMLYRAHEQTVDLYFIPNAGGNHGQTE